MRFGWAILVSVVGIFTAVNLKGYGGGLQQGQAGQRPDQQARGRGRGGQDGRGRGGPAGVFRTEVPDSPLNVIAGAPAEHSVLLSICSLQDSHFELVYSCGPISGSREGDLRGSEPKTIELDDLKSDSQYSYVLTTGSSKVSGEFRTARKKGSSFVFDIQADSHLDENTDLAVYENTLKNEIADHPDFLVDLGDTFMVDKYAQYQDSLKQYKAQRYWFSVLGSKMSVFLCLGNHDGEQGWVPRGEPGMSAWAQAERQFYFPTIRANSFYTGAPSKGLYYSWTWGDALFVVLDPFVNTTQKPRSEGEGWNWSLGKAQFDWLESTLKGSKSKFKFLFIHHLVGGFGREARGGVEASNRFEWGDDAEFPTMRTGWAEPVHALMKRYGATVLFHGHDHLYVRQQRDRITYLEVPQPSAARENTRSAEEYGYTTGKLLPSSGHIRVTVSPAGAKYEYVKSRLQGLNREVVDSAEISAAQ